MIDLLSRNKKHAGVIEVFEKMRAAGYFPDAISISQVLNAYGKLREFEKAEIIYKEMQEERCVFPDEIHFQMLSLYGAQGNLEAVEMLFDRLESDPNVNKRELNLVVSSIVEKRKKRLDDASRISSQRRERLLAEPLLS
ncbi:hypothetical protein IFM89_037818 [Coptis chinensis]|nr:hypothetical protein IFM89_037818 [Coptis chinensis]